MEPKYYRVQNVSKKLLALKLISNTMILTLMSTYPFEYYIFHFAYHLTNPWLQQPQQENVWTNWETIYVQLAHNYLNHFLPRDNSAVLPIIGPYVKKTPPRKLMQSPESKRLVLIINFIVVHELPNFVTRSADHSKSCNFEWSTD